MEISFEPKLVIFAHLTMFLIKFSNIYLKNNSL